MDCLSCWDIHLSSHNTKSSLTRFIQRVNILFLHIRCLTQGIDVISPNWNSAAVRIIPAFMVRVIAFENTVLEQLIQSQDCFKTIFHLRKGMLWVRLALCPVCVDCLLSTLRPDVLACGERETYIFAMEQNNKIPSISISDRPIQFILPWRKFVSTRVSSSADVISTKYPPCSIQNLGKTNENYITIS